MEDRKPIPALDGALALESPLALSLSASTALPLATASERKTEWKGAVPSSSRNYVPGSGRAPTLAEALAIKQEIPAMPEVAASAAAPLPMHYMPAPPKSEGAAILASSSGYNSAPSPLTSAEKGVKALSDAWKRLLLGTTQLPPRRIVFGSLLGNGAFGQVFHGQWNARLVALKEIAIAYAKKAFWHYTEREIVESVLSKSGPALSFSSQIQYNT